MLVSLGTGRIGVSLFVLALMNDRPLVKGEKLGAVLSAPPLSLAITVSVLDVWFMPDR